MSYQSIKIFVKYIEISAEKGEYITPELKKSIATERYLIDIIEKLREAINELLANIELAHSEEYKQYRELPAVDEAYKLTEE